MLVDLRISVINRDQRDNLAYTNFQTDSSPPAERFDADSLAELVWSNDLGVLGKANGIKFTAENVLLVMRYLLRFS